MNENITLCTTQQQISSTFTTYNDNYDQLLQDIIISKSQHAMIELQLFDEYEDLRLIGMIEDIDAKRGVIRIDGEWFQLNKVKGISR
ncbi:hypothetical protein [Paenibacillus endoradicis]|uniref:hypothetical protein n=1 Tax=Paenibacillus endoradicis TaxID=2972487 RepID=UPI0021597EAA|nr:hypothetical protein [Paenibacillus endoradicis]MCR8660392.1 hypothetical protein [Paenibacillus endoradicis]